VGQDRNPVMEEAPEAAVAVAAAAVDGEDGMRLVRGGGACGTGAVPAGARALVPRVDAGPGVAGGHRV
jgi:hypothetical protein